MLLAHTLNHPTKANTELRKHLSHIPLSGQCHYMLISSFITKENTQLPIGRDIKGSNPAILHSLEMDHSLRKLSWLSPPCGREMFPSLICVSQMTRFPPSGHVLCEKMARAPLQRFHAILSHLMTHLWNRGIKSPTSSSMAGHFAQSFHSMWCSWRDLISWLWLKKVRSVRIHTVLM